MTEFLGDESDALRRIDLKARRAAEFAEARVERFNEVLLQLYASNPDESIVLLGKVVHQQDYTPGLGPSDSNLVYQAAVLMPEGIGVIAWDSEHFLSLQKDPRDREADARNRFTSFDNCSAIVKSKLLPHVTILIQQLLHRFELGSE